MCECECVCVCACACACGFALGLKLQLPFVWFLSLVFGITPRRLMQARTCVSVCGCGGVGVGVGVGVCVCVCPCVLRMCICIYIYIYTYIYIYRCVYDVRPKLHQREHSEDLGGRVLLGRLAKVGVAIQELDAVALLKVIRALAIDELLELALQELQLPPSLAKFCHDAGHCEIPLAPYLSCRCKNNWRCTPCSHSFLAGLAHGVRVCVCECAAYCVRVNIQRNACSPCCGSQGTRPQQRAEIHPITPKASSAPRPSNCPSRLPKKRWQPTATWSPPGSSCFHFPSLAAMTATNASRKDANLYSQGDNETRQCSRQATLPVLSASRRTP